MKKYSLKYSVILFAVLLLVSGCVEKAPSRDEIPPIKTLIKDFESAVSERNMARMDSLMAVEAVKLGYSSLKILEDVYTIDSISFYKFGGLDISYLPKKGIAKFNIMADSADTGRPAEIMFIKSGKTWLIKRFDLK